MKTPGYIDMDKIVPPVEKSTKPFFPPTYNVPYAHRKNFRNQDMSLCKQWYDARTVYFYLLEVRAHTSFDLPVKITHPDIHWLYQLKGSKTAPSLDLHLRDQHHTTLALREGDYHLQFDQGHHISAGFVAERGWIERHTHDKSHYLHKHLEFLNTSEVDRPSLFDTQETTLITLKNLLLLTQSSHAPSIELDGVLAAYAGMIIQEHLRMYELSTDASEHSLIHTIHNYISMIATQEGDMPRIEEIAEHFGVSQKQLRNAHFETYGENPKSYLMRKRLDYSYTLLQETFYTPTLVTFKLGFSHLSHFSRLFKKQFGIPPSHVKKIDP